jgi:hypothetical protein
MDEVKMVKAVMSFVFEDESLLSATIHLCELLKNFMENREEANVFSSWVAFYLLENGAWKQIKYLLEEEMQQEKKEGK